MKIKIGIALAIVMAVIWGTASGFAAGENIEIYMNKNYSGYKEETGLFFDDVQNKDASGKTTRYSYSANARVSFSPEITVSGNYIVYYYNTGHTSNRDQQEFIIDSDDGEATVKLNLKGNEGWKYLGVYKFSKDGNAKITMTRDRFGGCIRTGMVKVMSTDKPTAVAYSQDPPKNERHYLPGNGIFVNNSFKSDNYTFEMTGGNFSTSGVTGADGRAVKYTYSADAVMRYRPNIPQSGKYHVLYYISQNGSYTSQKMRANIYHKNGTAKVLIDCTKHNGWLYLGQYDFPEGTEGCLETKNEDAGKVMMSGGAYFVSIDDPEFDSSLYATIDNPGSKEGAVFNENGECIITNDSIGYCETGLASKFKTAGDFINCEGRYSRYLTAGSAGCSMKFTAKINETGKYEVFYYMLYDSNNSAAQKVIISDKRGSKELTLDCTQQEGWVSLGTYSFADDSIAVVELPSAGDNSIVRSGGIKFVKK